MPVSLGRYVDVCCWCLVCDHSFRSVAKVVLSKTRIFADRWPAATGALSAGVAAFLLRVRFECAGFSDGPVCLGDLRCHDLLRCDVLHVQVGRL